MWITKSQFLFLAILSLFYPIFLNFHGDFRYGFPLSSSSQYKLFPHALGRLELSPTQIAVVHFPIKGMFLQNQIWLSADHQTLLVMEQNKDWWVPKHQDRQKNALVDHDRSRWLRGPGGLCVAVYRTSSKWNAQSEVLAKQSCATALDILRWHFCIMLLLLWSCTLFGSLTSRNTPQTWWKYYFYLRVCHETELTLPKPQRAREFFFPLSSLLLKVTAAFCSLDVAPWSCNINTCPCTHIQHLSHRYERGSQHFSPVCHEFEAPWCEMALLMYFKKIKKKLSPLVSNVKWAKNLIIRMH